MVQVSLFSLRSLGITTESYRYVHGERVVLPPDPENPRLLQVLDFGRSASRPGGYLGPTSESPALHCTVELHTEPSTLHDDLLGSESVTTSLPYRKITRYVDEEYGLFLIDEEQIIAVNDLVCYFLQSRCFEN
jgi:hypothetical protein